MPDETPVAVEAADTGAVNVGAEGTVEETATPMTDVAAPTETTTESAVEALFEIDGTPITLEEARSGYLRQADYTRKTQEIAERNRQLAQYEALATALDTNPELALKAIAEATGYKVLPPDQAPDPYVDLDPEEARIARLEQSFAQREERERQAAIAAELDHLRQTYGDFDETELLTHAIRSGATNLSTAFRSWKFDSLEAELAAVKAGKESESAREAAKSAAQVVHSTTGVTGAQPAPEPVEYAGIREAWAAAKKQLGL